MQQGRAPVPVGSVALGERPGDPRVRFLGRFTQQLDPKHRAILPQAFRAAIGEAELRRGLVITRGLDGCLWLFPWAGWHAVVRRLCTSAFAGREARMFQRLFIGEAARVDVDKSGRIEIPAHLRERAGINCEVVWLGVGSRMELWAPERWQEVGAAALSHYEELAEASRAR